MNEFWKDIPKFIGLYQISNKGNIRSIKFNKTKILKVDTSNQGYKRIKLYLDGNRNWFSIHRLVCCAFIDENLLDSELVVNHINGIRDDNRLENLEIISQLENVIDGVVRKGSLKINSNLFNNNTITYISTKKWEVFYDLNTTRISLGFVESTSEAIIAIRTAELIFANYIK